MLFIGHKVHAHFGVPITSIEAAFGSLMERNPGGSGDQGQGGAGRTERNELLTGLSVDLFR